MSNVAVRLSQESLFFPLPFTNATIDNVVQITNTLSPVAGNKRTNVISFKVLSAVRHRYSVRPAVGFIAPGEAITINFSLDPESIRSNPDPEARALPTEKTNDVMYVDFALVCGTDGVTTEELNGKFLNAWVSHGGGVKGVNDKKDVVEEASQFWKARGAAKPSGDRSSLRKKLACVFAARDAVPESLVVSMKAEGDRATAAAAAAAAAAVGGGHGAAVAAAAVGGAPPPPVSRPPVTSETRRGSTAPPDAPPSRHSTHSPSASNTPRASRISGRRTPEAVAADGHDGVAARGSPSPAPAPATPQRQTLATAAANAKKPFGLQQAAMVLKDDKAEKHKTLWKSVMHFKVPYAVAGVLVLCALLCGVFETHTFLSWLIAGK